MGHAPELTAAPTVHSHRARGAALPLTVTLPNLLLLGSSLPSANGLPDSVSCGGDGGCRAARRTGVFLASLWMGACPCKREKADPVARGGSGARGRPPRRPVHTAHRPPNGSPAAHCRRPRRPRESPPDGPARPRRPPGPPRWAWARQSVARDTYCLKASSLAFGGVQSCLCPPL